VTLPLGYRYASVYAGIRKDPRPDLALLVSDVPAAAAAVFTTNMVQAAPVRVARANLKATRGTAQAVLVNAGNANCSTRTGDRVATTTVKAAAKALRIDPAHVVPASTGVIGVELDAALIVNALPQLAAGLSPERFDDFADAILTTDLVRKTAFDTVGGCAIAGATKGSGMIQPNMATTLGFVVTDAVVTASELREILTYGVGRSYHRITVDGDTSTNDMVVVFGNGASGKRPPRKKLREAITAVLVNLAQQIARDGEGAKKLVHIHVSGAASEPAAVQIARSIANSPLVKTAIAGSDPNWGRIIAAAGYSGVKFDPANVDIFLQGVRVCRNGLAAAFDEAELKLKLDAADCHIEFRMQGSGKREARFWTCDFTDGYIRINASYRT